jgi:hypothetical protein
MYISIVDADDTEIYAGEQTLDDTQVEYGDPRYLEPPMPADMPVGWSRDDDAMLQTFVGDGPEKFETWNSNLPNGVRRLDGLSHEFLSIRMAQCGHLNLSMSETVCALAIREAQFQDDEERRRRGDWGNGIQVMPG